MPNGPGVAVIDEATLQRWLQQSDRTTFLFDVRSPEEYAAGHYPGSLSAPGGQLVQETDHFASVRGARIVLLDDDGIRAAITGSWLAQMGWETARLSALSTSQLSERGVPAAEVPPRPAGGGDKPGAAGATAGKNPVRWCSISPPAPTLSLAISPARGG